MSFLKSYRKFCFGNGNFSPSGSSSVNADNLPRDERGLFARKKEDELGDVARRSVPLKRAFFGDFFFRFLVKAGGHFRLDEAGCNTVDVDSRGADFF